jgi:hypothetical protein
MVYCVVRPADEAGSDAVTPSCATLMFSRAATSFGSGLKPSSGSFLLLNSVTMAAAGMR